MNTPTPIHLPAVKVSLHKKQEGLPGRYDTAIPTDELIPTKPMQRYVEAARKASAVSSNSLYQASPKRRIKGAFRKR